jgi:hypothetical protein
LQLRALLISVHAFVVIELQWQRDGSMHQVPNHM